MLSLHPAINKLSRVAGEGGGRRAQASCTFASRQIRSSLRRAGGWGGRAGAICEWVRAVTRGSRRRRDGEVGKGRPREMFAPRPSGYF